MNQMPVGLISSYTCLSMLIVRRPSPPPNLSTPVFTMLILNRIACRRAPWGCIRDPFVRSLSKGEELKEYI